LVNKTHDAFNASAVVPAAVEDRDFAGGWEVLDEAASLADVGVIDGSILLLTFRRRRPVR